jgi:hypothetical protein
MNAPILKAVAILLLLGVLGYQLYEFGAGETIGLGSAPKEACKGEAPLKAPTLAQMYDFSERVAKEWNADAVVVRLDNLAMSGPLQPGGTSTHWTSSFYSVSAKKGILIHTGNGELHCSTYKGEAAGNVPALQPGFVRDGAALYALAEKNGRAQLAKGLGVGVNLWATGDRHATWQLEFVDNSGYPAGVRVIVDANTGAVEEVSKH